MRRTGAAAAALLSLVIAACDPGPTGERAPRSRAEKDAREEGTGTGNQTRRGRAARTGRQVAPSGERLRFAVIGDFGAGTDAQHAVARRMCALYRRRPFQLVVTTGDNVYPSGESERFDDVFFRPFGCLFDKGVRWHAALGNHDVQSSGGEDQLQEPAFGMSGRNYVVRRQGLRLVVADSNSLQEAWLRDAVAPAPGDRWTVVVFHHPVFSPGPHGSTPGFSTQLIGMFTSRGVDLVLNGHDHLYSVSKPIGGIRYVVTGGGGARLYDCSPQWFTQVCFEKHHFLVVGVRADRLVVEAVGVDGAVLHSFSTPGLPPR